MSSLTLKMSSLSLNSFNDKGTRGPFKGACEPIVKVYHNGEVNGTYSFFPFKKINIFDEEFWDLKQLTINGKLYAYSRTTRLILELLIEDEGAEYTNRAIRLFGIRGEGNTIIRGKKIPVEILKWCLKQKIQVFKNKPVFWL